MPILRKITLSRTEPEKNALWLDPETESIKYFNDGWQVLSNGGGKDYAALKASITALQESKQDTLVSGTNIKTINGTSLLGSGDVSIASMDEETVKEITDSVIQEKCLLQKDSITTSEIDEACEE